MLLSFARSASGGFGRATARVAARDRYVAGRAIERHGALMGLRHENDRSAAGRRAVAIERDGGGAGKIGCRAVERIRLFLQIDGVSGARLVEAFHVGERVRGVCECDRLTSAREPRLGAGELQISLYAPGGRLDAVEQQRVEKCRRRDGCENPDDQYDDEQLEDGKSAARARAKRAIK